LAVIGVTSVVIERESAQDQLARANQELEQRVSERERLISIIEATPDFVGFAETNGKVPYLNRAARQALNLPADFNFDQMRIRDLQQSGGSSRVVKEGVAVACRDGSWKGEVAWLPHDGREIPISLLLQTHRSPDGDIELISAIGRDISDLKDAELTLQRNERLASVGTLAAGIAHEINNPLGAMMLTCEYAHSKVEDPKIVSESLENIQAQVERCARIVRSVLQFSRDGCSQKWKYDLREIILRSQDLTRQQAERADVSVEIHSNLDCCEVEVNPIEMEQVFVSLISNAIQASDGKSKVFVKIEPTDDCIQVVVEDEGQGIEAAALPRIFDPFFSSRLNTAGTGLGLSISHGIIRDHGGRMDVWSQSGESTRITIELPLIQLKEGSPSAQIANR